MAETLQLGGKVRALRRREGLSQVQLAERLGISASYLNLIEHNRRPVSAPVLIKLAQVLKLELQALSLGDDTRLAADLREAFGAPLFNGHDLTAVEVRDLVSGSPALARAVLSLYHSYQGARESANHLAARI